VTLIFSEVCTALHKPPPTFHSGINFSGKRRLLVAVPASNAPPPLSPHPIRSDVHLECLSGAKRDEDLWVPNLWVPNLVNIEDGVAPTVLHPESISRYDGQCEDGRRQTASKSPEDDKPPRFVRIAGSS